MRPLIAACGLLGWLAGAYAVHREQPVYDASAELLLRPTGSSNLALVYSGSAPEPRLSIRTQARVLTSDSVLGRAADDLHLAGDPRFLAYAKPGQMWDGSGPAMRAAAIATLRAGLNVSYEDGPAAPVVGASVTGDAGDTDSDEGTGRSKRKLREDLGPHSLSLSFTSPDPTIGAAIVNSVVQAYTARTFELRRAAMLRVSAQLSASLEEFRQKVEMEERSLLQLERTSGDLGTALDHDPDAVELAVLTGQATLFQARMRGARAKREVVLKELQRHPESIVSSATVELTELRLSVADAEAETARLEAVAGPRNPAVMEQQARTNALRLELAAEQRRFEAQLAAELPLAEVQTRLLAAELRQERTQVESRQDAQLKATALKVQLARDTELYDVLVNNVRTAEIDAGYGTVSVEILKTAEAPGRVRAKDFVFRPLLTMVGGLGIGVAMALMVMSFPRAGLSGSERMEEELGMASFGEVALPEVGAALESEFAVAIRDLRERILLAAAGNPPRRIVFSGGSSGQGTSTLALSVAKALARPDGRVLLIDANTIRPSLHRRLRLDGRVGLSNVLSGLARLEDAVAQVREAPGLDVLLSGPVPTAALDRTGSDAMRLLLEDAERVYSCTVLDAAPLGAGQVQNVLSQSELVLVAVRQGSLGRRAVVRTRDAVRESGIHLAGFVITR